MVVCDERQPLSVQGLVVGVHAAHLVVELWYPPRDLVHKVALAHELAQEQLYAEVAQVLGRRVYAVHVEPEAVHLADADPVVVQPAHKRVHAAAGVTVERVVLLGDHVGVG